MSNPNQENKKKIGGGIRALVEARLKDELAPHHLTERETAVVLELLGGRTYSEIAKRLFITERTVKFHCQNIYGKVGVANRREFSKFIETML